MLPLQVAVASAGGAAALYPPEFAESIDSWLATARSIEHAAAAWCQPTAAVASAAQRIAARQQLESALARLEAALANSSHLAGARTTLADVSVLCSLLPLFQTVLGQDVQQLCASVTRWLQACAAEPQFAAVLGESWLPACAMLCCLLCRCLLSPGGTPCTLKASLHSRTSPCWLFPPIS